MGTWKKLLHTGNVVADDLNATNSSGQYLKTDGSGVLSWGTVTAGVSSITTGDGLDDDGSTTNLNISLDLAELTDGSSDVVGEDDKLIYLDDGVQKSKHINDIKLSEFDNDAGWTTNAGDITALTIAGDSGGGSQTSGNVSLTVAGGTGLTTTGTTNSVTIDFDRGGLTAITALTTSDEVLFFDDSDSDNVKRATMGDLPGAQPNATSNKGIKITDSGTSTPDFEIDMTNLAAMGGAAQHMENDLITMAQDNSIGTVQWQTMVGFVLANTDDDNWGTAGSTVTFDGSVTVDEDLEVTGTTTLQGVVTMNSSAVTTTDKVIEVADGAGSVANALDSGIAVDTGQAILPKILYTHAPNANASFGTGWKVWQGSASANADYENHVMGFYTGAGDPGSNMGTGRGQMYYDTTNDEMYVCTNNSDPQP